MDFMERVMIMSQKEGTKYWKNIEKTKKSLYAIWEMEQVFRQL